jgi:hypothetical protein
MRKEKPKLVSAEEGKTAVLIPHRHRESIRIGIVGEHQIRVRSSSLGQGEIHRSRLLGVGKANGGEVRIGLDLLRHRHHVPEPGPREGLFDPGSSDTVKWRIGDLDLPRFGDQFRVFSQSQDLLQIRLGDSLGDRNVKPSLSRQLEIHHRNRAQGSDRIHGPADALIVGRDDLRAVLPVDLVAIVGRRIVAGRDHDPRARPERRHRERANRSGYRIGKDVHRDAGAGQHASSVFRKLGRHAAAVPSHHDPLLPALGRHLEQVVREARGDPAHQGPVHTPRAGADRASEASRAESEPCRKPLPDLVEVAGIQKCLELHAGHGIRVLGDPCLRFRHPVPRVRGRCHRGEFSLTSS